MKREDNVGYIVVTIHRRRTHLGVGQCDFQCRNRITFAPLHNSNFIITRYQWMLSACLCNSENKNVLVVKWRFCRFNCE